MRTALLSCLAIFLSTILPAQNQGTQTGKKYPSFIILKEKPHKDQASQIFKELFDLTEKESLKAVGNFTDPLGFTHLTFQQYYDDIKVDGGTYRLHLKNDRIWYMSGSYLDIFGELSASPGQSAISAFQRATNHVNANRYAWEEEGSEPVPELVITADPFGMTPPRLAYKFDIYASAPLYRAFVYIDAHSGTFIKENLCIHHAEVNATGPSLYNGTVSFKAEEHNQQYKLSQAHVKTFDINNGTIHSNATDVISNTTNFTSDNTAVQAHWGAEQTYNYFLQKHGRQSFDNNGSPIRSYVHYGNKYNNAFWDGIRMTYGDGDGTTFNPLVSIDIVGHEIAHGVTNYSADLVYSYESGALNESFSDIFGEAIEYFATGSNDWSMGAEIRIGGGGGIRSMSDPNAFGDPDTYLGTYWYTGPGDNGGVHTNSGVQNKWFYILTEGESGTNDLGDSYDVTGIGIDKAAAIAYRNLTVYLSAYSNYTDARNGAIQSAIDLFGEGSPEVMATTDAWYAVGVGGQDGEILYCASGSNSAIYEWIAEVKVGAFSNASGSSSYTDYSSMVINLTAGLTYPITLTPAYANSAYGEYWKIWIDFNQDGDFNDGGELIYNAGGLNDSQINNSITIPPAANGTTRMRVSMKYNAAPSPCENFNYGEVEDYTVNISSGNPDDTEPPSPPENLTDLNTTQTSTNLTWDASTDNVGVIGYDIYVNGEYVGNTTATDFTITGLTAGTTYNLTVIAKDAAGNESTPSSITITTQNQEDELGYCFAKGNNAASEWIAQFSIDAFSHASGPDGYGDYTSQTVNLAAGQSYSIRLTPGFIGSKYDEYWKIWIDYNQDGDFEDIGELVFDAGGVSRTTVTGTITIPASAAGDTRLRVAMRYNAAPAPCGSFNYGEVEDYTVSISNDGGSDTSPPTTPENLIATNTTQTTTDLSWDLSSDDIGVIAYNVYLNGVFIGTTNTTNYTVTGLSPGTTYTVSVTAKDAAGNESSPGMISVTTENTEPDDLYCASQGNNVSSEWIAMVQIGSFSHSSDAEGYGNFKAITANLAPGQTYNLSLTPGFVSGAYAEYWRIWMDYNQDGDFDDAGELVFDAGSASNTTVTGTINIPADASGSTRMRVSMKYNTSPGACGAFNYGEVEDYTVSFSDDGEEDDGGDTGPSTLFAHYFETGWDGWSDGGSDCFRYSGPYSKEGEYSIRLRDDSGIASAMTSAAYDLSGYTEVNLKFSFYANSMEHGEKLHLRYFDGNSWKPLSILTSGISFATDQFHEVDITFNNNDYIFPNNARFRFLCEANSNQDQVYIDEVIATASGSAQAVIAENGQMPTVTLAGSNRSSKEEGFKIDRERKQLSETLKLFPNPARDILHINFSGEMETMRIVSANGLLIKEIRVNTTDINIDKLPKGVYYLFLQHDGGAMVKKFVKQ